MGRREREDETERATAGACPEPEGDDLLLAAIGRGDRDAFAALVARHARPMLALALRVTRSSAETDEIVQETFLKVWRLAARWQPEGEARFSTWLYRVVLNASLERQRHQPARPLDGGGAAPAGFAPGEADLAQVRERDRIIAQSLAEIPGRQRAVLALYYFADLSVPQAAEVMELSVPAVESLLSRGKHALRLALVRRGITGMGDM